MKRRWLALLPTAAAGGMLSLWIGRIRQEQRAWALSNEMRLLRPSEVFDPAMVEGLPAPAQRYFLHAIAPGTPLARTVRLTLHGAMRLRPGAGLLPMAAEQILAPPNGFMWKARVGRSFLKFQGFDRYNHGQGEMRWWLYGLVPIVKADGPYISRSAAGRVAGEAVLIPSTLLPLRGAQWEPVDESTANVRIAVDDESVTLTISVDPHGRLLGVSLLRWKDDAKDGTSGYVRFDVDEWAEERTFGGYTIPTRFRAGWELGQPDEFPFFYAVIVSACYR